MLTLQLCSSKPVVEKPTVDKRGPRRQALRHWTWVLIRYAVYAQVARIVGPGMCTMSMWLRCIARDGDQIVISSR